MRGISAHRARLAVAAVLLAIMVGACGDDSPCNHVINDVPLLDDCKKIAVERNCSDEVTYSAKNNRCKVENCGDCDGPAPTPTVEPAT